MVKGSGSRCRNVLLTLLDFLKFVLIAEELEMLALLVNTNAHGMGAQGLHNSDVALGIFPFVSMLNHSCWYVCHVFALFFNPVKCFQCMTQNYPWYTPNAFFLFKVHCSFLFCIPGEYCHSSGIWMPRFLSPSNSQVSWNLEPYMPWNLSLDLSSTCSTISQTILHVIKSIAWVVGRDWYHFFGCHLAIYNEDFTFFWNK